MGMLDPKSTVKFRFVPMTAEYAREILGWRYEPPYDFYNPGAGIDEEDLAATFLNPDYHYYVVLDAHGALIAYCCFGEDARVAGGDYTADALDMGGGWRPDLTGRGLGPQVMRAAMEFARSVFAPRVFRTTVAAWNVRALRACMRVGYRPAATFESLAGARFVLLMCAAPEEM